ncbi:MAG: translational GTPase TypA [Fusobacteria bacterium]|nr:translational GTPase TypA [Fusobacteriota bacterium]
MTKIKNIAIIAHVDHGKTTLVDAMLSQTNTLNRHDMNVERIMDSDDIEKERGITIFAKNASLLHNGYKINIVDTPGHADFGGEVQRILQMVDSVLLLVDAFEGPMPQTKYVLKKALEQGHRPIVVINKIDRPNSSPEKVVDMVFDLFVDLNANDFQLDFPIIYASAKQGIAILNLEDPQVNITPLLDMIVENVDDPSGDINKPLQMLITNLDYDNYIGKVGTGRIHNGKIEQNQTVALMKKDGTKQMGKITKIINYEGLEKIDVKVAYAGDIVSIAGLETMDVGETVADAENPIALPIIEIDEPTLSMTFMVNDSPFVGQDGRLLTSRQIYSRLLKELQSNISMKVERTEANDAFIVKGRGELQLSILIENMRREGFELQVSKPKVIFKEIDGKLHEPVELALVDVAEEYVGVVIEKLGVRKGEMINMIQGSDGYSRLEFRIPARGLIGFRGEFLTDTKGTGILNSSFLEYEEYRGNIPSRIRGVLIASEGGQTAAYGLGNVQERGTLFAAPGVAVYAGQIIGEHAKESDLTVNVCKGKQLTNMRASGTDTNVRLAPPRLFSLEQALEYIEDDELLEVTPESIRMRKKVLSETDRKRATRDSLKEKLL